MLEFLFSSENFTDSILLTAFPHRAVLIILRSEPMLTTLMLQNIVHIHTLTPAFPLLNPHRILQMNIKLVRLITFTPNWQIISDLNPIRSLTNIRNPNFTLRVLEKPDRTNNFINNISELVHKTVHFIQNFAILRFPVKTIIEITIELDVVLGNLRASIVLFHRLFPPVDLVPVQPQNRFH